MLVLRGWLENFSTTYISPLFLFLTHSPHSSLFPPNQIFMIHHSPRETGDLRPRFSGICSCEKFTSSIKFSKNEPWKIQRILTNISNFLIGRRSFFLLSASPLQSILNILFIFIMFGLKNLGILHIPWLENATLAIGGWDSFTHSISRLFH